MTIILSNKPKEIIKILKKKKEHVFKITKEVIYAIPESAVSHYSKYKDFLKFMKKHPKKVFTRYYQVNEEIKKINEL